ncbi:hypothetical protein AGMMS50239_41370 [Bacteroidia bacterium]|nr:hypothetical protein AGMMS50239_41370 [Bacteroidia bacterium]
MDTKITNVRNPIDASDAATKSYVDDNFVQDVKVDGVSVVDANRIAQLTDTSNGRYKTARYVTGAANSTLVTVMEMNGFTFQLARTGNNALRLYIYRPDGAIFDSDRYIVYGTGTANLGFNVYSQIGASSITSDGAPVNQLNLVYHYYLWANGSMNNMMKFTLIINNWVTAAAGGTVIGISAVDMTDNA